MFGKKGELLDAIRKNMEMVMIPVNDYDREDLDDDDAPEGCLACGGPYPYCKEGCPLFEE